MPDAEKIIHLSRLFGVSTDYLLLDEVENPSPSALSSARLIALPMAENPDLQRRRFRIGFGISMLVIGLITILAALILAGIWSLYTTEWYTEWGPFGTALFHTWRLIPLLLGLVAFLVGGGVLLNEYWRIGSTSSQ